MKIKMLRAYQAVSFENTLNTYFVDERYRNESHGSRVVRVKLEATQHGVLAYNDTCAVLIGWANVGSSEIDVESIGKLLGTDKKISAKEAKA